jgi:hypothetical protein
MLPQNHKYNGKKIILKYFKFIIDLQLHMSISFSHSKRLKNKSCFFSNYAFFSSAKGKGLGRVLFCYFFQTIIYASSLSFFIKRTKNNYCTTICKILFIRIIFCFFSLFFFNCIIQYKV